MHRERVDGGVLGEDLAGAVAVVEVEVDDEHPLRETARPQACDGHRHVVEDAEPHAAAGGMA